ncbi:XrtA-associated tyrosine autokinase [Magnetospira sp. QH-2]|uniref:XrtA-associated tyrosine autokinase n=1 Tax=Magnetospira sp. (strain QH-2) TaxID=1288970 RepID=UPI0008141400|nr:XrtA-associated tyrosine autokinase [Magnetospira sp. QH-2]
MERKKKRPSLIERAAERFSSSGVDFSEKPTTSARKAEADSRPGGGAEGGEMAVEPKGPPAPVEPTPAKGSDGGGKDGYRGGNHIDIDLDAIAEKGMITSRGERSRMTEEFRVIKRPLLLRALATGEEAVKDGNLIMVTSAIPGEGKTYTSVNLAMSIAKERDVFVLLVDADLSRPNVMPTLGLKADRGLVDLLENEDLDVADVLMRTNIPNLSIIPAGRSHSMGTELLASERAGQVINEIAMRYRNRVIIFDTAPVLASSEGGALLKHVGQIILVVEFERTKEVEVLGALDMLDNCEHINLVLNKAGTRLAGGHGGSAYYGSYYAGGDD